ncbi:PucR family transcriptional regulator [Aquibacillus sediminis]|uniref:PucR family transcriptional regulator n=1 Tax=Aquibacillus sediminis TaxID=2574734 RepID=UPI0011090352|nr:PucR family transcriptional regulator [Aquibacillus sediminis]
MGLTVHDIVRLPIMKTSKVKSGKQLLNEKSIEWISVMELPVENFVRMNEFVLSTGIGCENNPDLLEQFVRDVIQSGASALAIATGRYIFDIPDRILQYAEEHNFIIIDIPWEIRFADVLQTVMHEITVDKQGERQKAENVRKELTNCVLEDKGLTDICRILYKHIRMPVAIMDRSTEVRANKYFDKTIFDMYHDETNPLQPIPPTEIHYTDHPLYYHLQEYQLSDKMWFQLNILNNHKSQGYIVFQPKRREDLSWFVMSVLEHALTACALFFVKENAIEITEIRLKDNFVLNLAKHKMPIDDQLLSKARLLGYDLQNNYTCILGDISNKSSMQEKNKNDNPESSSLQSLNYYIQKEINYAGKLLGRKTMTTFDEGEVIVFLEADHHPHTESSNQFIDTIERRLSELLVGVELSWGIAPQQEGKYRFYQSYQQAKTALNIGKQQNGLGERTFFSDTKINRLLMALSKESEIASIVKETLDPLLEYDRKRKTDLIHTFQIYNKYKGNVSQTARALNLHRQSLLHRLRNIESLTKLSLVDSDDAFLLELSVRLWTLKKIE